MFYYLLIVNILSFIIYGLDKLFAIFKFRRVPEVNLFFLAFTGGFIGSILGMILFRHKIRKNKFWIVNILCLFFWTSLYFWFII